MAPWSCHVTVCLLALSSDGLILRHYIYFIYIRVLGIASSFTCDHLGKYLKTGGDVAWADTLTQCALS